MKSFFPIVCLGVLLAGAPGWVVAGSGSALSFNGTNQYLSTTIPALPSNYTISAWVYLRSGGTDASRLGVLTGTDCGDSVELLIHSTNTSATGSQYLELGRCDAFNGQLSSRAVPLNQWTYIAVTVSSNKNIAFYIDGSAAGGWSAPGRNTELGPEIHLADNVTRHFNGMLDEVQIWNRVLTQGDIQTNMYQVPNLADSGLVAYWPMVTDAGSVLTPDASGHGHTGLFSTYRPLQAMSGAPWPLNAGVAGSSPYTNECHAGFTDPGAFVSNTPACVDAGGNFSVVLKKDGTVGGWGSLGSNDRGQLNIPSSATNLVALSAGYYFVLALRANGGIIGWGDNRFDQLGVSSSATNIVALAAGYFHSLALRADGRVVAWGYNSYGQTDVPASASNAIAIAAGNRHSLALKADGTVVAWGDNTYSQANVPSSATNGVAVAAGGDHSLALKADGTIVAWGNNTYGQTSVPSSATNVIAIAGGDYHSLALRADGTVVAWGQNSNGQTNVPASATNVIAIAAGGNAGLAMKADGAIVAWGANSNVSANAYRLYSFPFTTNGIVDTNTVGSYSLTYTVTNAIGTSTVTRIVEVVDTTAPVLTLLGTNPMVIVVGTPYVEPGATAVDACGGDFTSGIVVTGYVDSGTVGIYTCRYAVADSQDNTRTTERVVRVHGVPSISGLSADCTTTNELTGIRGAGLFAVVNANGLASTAFFQFCLNTAYSCVQTNQLTAGFVGSNLSVSVSNLGPGLVYRWRVIATNALGETVSDEQLLEVPLPYARGDFNGNGVVEQGELNDVYGGYWQDNPTQITNAMGLGRTEVKLVVDNLLGWDLTAQYSDDLATWSNLSNRAIPVFQFTDPDATNHPTRTYRLLAP